MGSVRIKIPNDVEGLIDLASNIIKQQKKEGDTSPLTVIKSKTIEDTIAKASQLHKEAAKLSRQLERIYQQRDRQLPKIRDYVLKSRDVLKAVNRGRLKELGLYGFTVDAGLKRKKASS